MIFIGIPTVNLKKYLIQTVVSINLDEPYKVLIVDNGSTDDTRDWVQNSPYDKIMNPSNYGVAKAWNQILYWGMSHNDCEAIFILNNDIVLHPDAMWRMMESIRENGKEGVSGVNIGRSPDMLRYTTKPEPRYSPAMNFSCFGFTIPLITRVGVFDEGFEMAYFEDNDYHHRMMDEGIDASCDLWAPFSHYGSRTIHEAGVKHGDAFSKNKEYFRKKWGFVP